MRTVLRATLPALAFLASIAVAQAQTGQPAGPADRSGMGMGMMGGRDNGAMMQMMMMRGGMGMPYEHIEGRITFLKAEIGITEAQATVWDAFAEAMRGNAETARSMHQQIAERVSAEDMTWPARIEGMAAMMAARAEALKAMEAAAKPLYDALSEEQRSKADSLFTGPIGMK